VDGGFRGAPAGSPAAPGGAVSAAGPVPAAVRWLARRLFPLLATAGLVAVGMASTTWWGPDLLGTHGWMVPHDLWGTLVAARRLAHLDVSGLYTQPTGLVSLPGAAVILIPVTAVTGAAGLSLRVPGAHNPHPGAWLLAGPYLIILSAVALFAADAIAEDLGVTRPRRALLAAAGAVALSSVSVGWGHPEDAVAVGLLLFAILALTRARTGRAGWLMGAAVAAQPLVLLALPVILMVIQPRRLAGFLARAAAPGALLLAAAAAANWPATIHAVTVQPNWPAIDHPTPWTALAPHLSHGAVAAGPARLLAILAACGCALAAGRRWRAAPATAGWSSQTLAELLWWAAVALAMRSVFEPVMVAYYLWPVLAVALVTASRNWPRLVATSLAAATLTCVGQVSWRGPWIWWASMVAGLGLTVFLARVPLRPKGATAPSPTDVRCGYATHERQAVNTENKGKDRRSVMKQLANLPRRARWAVPAGAVVVAGGVLAGSVIPAAQAAPLLPSRTPAQLLAALAGKTPAPPLTGTVVETASLGLPALPSTGDPASLPSLLTGSHTIKVWYSDPAHYRLAVPQSMSESDVIRNGSSAWLWDSSGNTVTHVALPAGAPAPSLPSAPLTPQQAAHQVLARIGPGTAVSVDSNVTVAGEAAYQLVLAPKSSSSLAGQVRIAIDAQHNVPLRVQVFAKKAASPAIQVGFSSVSFTRPAAANFAFTPPAGAKVTQESAGSRSKASGKASRSNNITNGLTVLGKGWLAVTDLPQSSLPSLTGTAPPGGPVGPGLAPFRGSSESAAPASGGPGGSGIPALGGGTGAIFGALLQSAKRVSGPWGSGCLLRTSLVSVLITSNGRILIGAVTPDVLYQAATQAGHPLAARWHHAAAAATSK
jgi:outer membrane lipoprotein-sorting protein